MGGPQISWQGRTLEYHLPSRLGRRFLVNVVVVRSARPRRLIVPPVQRKLLSLSKLSSGCSLAGAMPATACTTTCARSRCDAHPGLNVLCHTFSFVPCDFGDATAAWHEMLNSQQLYYNEACFTGTGRAMNFNREWLHLGGAIPTGSQISLCADEGGPDVGLEGGSDSGCGRKCMSAALSQASVSNRPVSEDKIVPETVRRGTVCVCAHAQVIHRVMAAHLIQTPPEEALNKRHPGDISFRKARFAAGDEWVIEYPVVVLVFADRGVDRDYR